MSGPYDQNQYNQQWQQGYQQSGYAGYPGHDPYGQPLDMPHSGLGMASTIVGGAGILLMCLAFGAAMVIFANNPSLAEVPEDQMPGSMLMVGCTMMFAMLLYVVGLGLGIGSLFQTSRKKTWPIVGICINGGMLLASGCLTLIGLVSP